MTPDFRREPGVAGKPGGSHVGRRAPVGQPSAMKLGEFRHAIPSFGSFRRGHYIKGTALPRLPPILRQLRQFPSSALRRVAVDFGKPRVSAAHFGQDCGGLWQGESWDINANRCSRLWKLTSAPGPIRVSLAQPHLRRASSTAQRTCDLTLHRRRPSLCRVTLRGSARAIAHATERQTTNAQAAQLADRASAWRSTVCTAAS